MTGMQHGGMRGIQTQHPLGLRPFNVFLVLAFMSAFMGTLALQERDVGDAADVPFSVDSEPRPTGSTIRVAARIPDVNAGTIESPAQVWPTLAPLTPEVRDAADQAVETAIMAEDVNNRVRAIQNLEDAPLQLAMAALIQVLQDGETVNERRAAVASLLHLGLQRDPGRTIAAALRAALNDPEPSVSADAGAALGALGEEAP